MRLKYYLLISKACCCCCCCCSRRIYWVKVPRPSGNLSFALQFNLQLQPLTDQVLKSGYEYFMEPHNIWWYVKKRNQRTKSSDDKAKPWTSRLLAVRLFFTVCAYPSWRNCKWQRYNEGLGQDEKRSTADFFVVNKPSMSSETKHLTSGFYSCRQIIDWSVYKPGVK